jgi:bla regulator protein BlaR1
MTYAINGVMLALGSSLATSIVAKATLITAVGLIATWLARRSRASVRHALLAASLAALLALPIAAFLVPPMRIAVEQQPTVPSHQAEAIDRTQPYALTDANTGITPSISRRSLPTLYDLLLAGWFAGTALLLSRMIAGLWQVHCLHQFGLPWRLGQAVVERMALDAGISRYVEVLLHESLPAPVTCGVVRPVILLPLDA